MGSSRAPWSRTGRRPARRWSPRRTSSVASERVSVPSSRTRPALGSRKRNNTAARVDLPRPALADDGDPTSGRDYEIDIVKYRGVTGPTGAHAFDPQGMRSGAERSGVLRLGDRGGVVQDLEDALESGLRRAGRRTASGACPTTSKTASGVRTTTASRIGSRPPVWTRCAPSASRTQTTAPVISAVVVSATAWTAAERRSARVSARSVSAIAASRSGSGRRRRHHSTTGGRGQRRVVVGGDD